MMAKRPDAAQTAFGPMVIVACEQHVPEAQRLIDDPLAIEFLPPRLKFIVRMSRWAPVRQMLMAVTEKRAPGMWAAVACRKRYADERVASSVSASIGAVIILGAGLDTRAYRLAAPAGIDTYELDLAANSEFKRERLQAFFGSVPKNVRLLPVDFDSDDLSAALTKCGFPVERPTMFVWEGVTQYLTEDGVRRTLAFLSGAAPGSQLVFSFVRQDFLNGTDFHGAEPLYRQFVEGYRVWHFGLAPEAVAPLLNEYGWVENEQVGAAEFVEKYVQPTGRDLKVAEIERIVWATKT